MIQAAETVVRSATQFAVQEVADRIPWDRYSVVLRGQSRKKTPGPVRGGFKHITQFDKPGAKVYIYLYTYIHPFALVLSQPCDCKGRGCQHAYARRNADATPP